MDELCECGPQWLEQLTVGLRASAEILLVVGMSVLLFGIASWVVAKCGPDTGSQPVRNWDKAAMLAGGVLSLVSLLLLLSLPIL